MSTISVEQALLKANSHAKKGAIKEAQKLYYSILQVFPKNKRAQQGLIALNAPKYSTVTQGFPQEIINNLINLYNDGRLEAVVEQAQSLIGQDPKAWVVWNILGAANKALGRVDEAFDAFKKVTELNSIYAEGFNNLGVTLKDQGKLDEALASYEKALSLKPNFVEACNNIGNILKSQGKLDEALASYEKSISLKPDYAEAHYNMGNVFQDKGQFKKAIASYEKALAFNSNYAEPLNNMGNIFKDQGKLDKARLAYAKILSFKPDYAEAHYNIGVILRDQSKFDEAIAAFSKAISLKPDYAEAYNNYGIALRDQGKSDEAISAFNKLLSFKPEFASAHFNMGLTLADQRKLDEALESYEKALSFEPDYAGAHFNIGKVLIDQDKLDEAISFFDKALELKPNHASARLLKVVQQARICDWTSVEEERPFWEKVGKTGKIGMPVFPFLSLEDNPNNQRLRSEINAKQKFSQAPLPFPTRPTTRPQRLRIGYFSSDYKQHPVAYLISKLLEQHNRDSFEIFGYSLLENSQSAVRQRLINAFDYFIDVEGLSDRDVALRARQDNIDIAIDLMGYTKNARTGIFAYRAAPIQINYLGYPGTLAADFMDYIVTDQHLVPPKNQKYFAEKQLYLPYTYMPTDNSRKLSNYSVNRSDFDLPDNSFVFCAFNNNYKITSAEFDIWMRLLTNVKGSVLWMRPSNRWAELNLKKEAQKRKVDPARIIYADRVPMDIHLARHSLADLFLDTFNYNAHTTAQEALWAGLPVITKTGETFAARVAGSLLNAIGLNELITESEEAYEALALELATHPARLAQIKAKLEANCLTQPLFDTEQYTRHLETAYQMAYDLYFDGQETQHLFVPKN